MQNLDGVWARCPDCRQPVLAKSYYAHIVLRHRRVPFYGETCRGLFPPPAALRRLAPHVHKIIAETEHAAAQLKAVVGSAVRRQEKREAREREAGERREEEDKAELEFLRRLVLYLDNAEGAEEQEETDQQV